MIEISEIFFGVTGEIEEKDRGGRYLPPLKH
jgi:hypothetical protein